MAGPLLQAGLVSYANLRYAPGAYITCGVVELLNTEVSVSRAVWHNSIAVRVFLAKVTARFRMESTFTRDLSCVHVLASLPFTREYSYTPRRILNVRIDRAFQHRRTRFEGCVAQLYCCGMCF